jgi:septal ring factor EnvC (AmiA/AmiB activator)
VLGAGGGLLSFFGVLLVGLSIWSNASVEVSPEGFRAEFERLEKEVNKVAVRSQQVSEEVQAVTKANNAISREIKVVAENIDINKTQFLKLTNVLKQKQVLNVNQIKSINDPVKNAPVINKRVLDSAILKLEPG